MRGHDGVVVHQRNAEHSVRFPDRLDAYAGYKVIAAGAETEVLVDGGVCLGARVSEMRAQEYLRLAWT